MPRTRIICTIGPASEGPKVLRKMMLAGMDVVRFNCSHATHRQIEARIDMIRRINAAYRRHVRILLDLEGFRIRVGGLKDHKPVELKARDTIWLVQGDLAGAGNTVSFDYEGPLSDIKTGQHIYIDDGNIDLVVKGRGKKKLKTEVVVGGILKEHKGVNIPEAKLRFAGMTAKDADDIRFGVRCKVDYIAQSFIRTRKDVEAVRKTAGPGMPLIAKIETREGIRNIDGIIDASDGIMVARGDMGVSIPIYEVPVVQKMIIRKCNKKRKFVITATQMLESMVENARPTRAEVADVANAILDGTDFVMLSAESAVGRYPVGTVKMMNDIIKFTERAQGERTEAGLIKDCLCKLRS
ncbi:MAG: pyruvate kinase [Candidatus Omnitrophica bacterium]|nr:pyruvate kinase [Candidatus Omnitrophota bacterium]